MDKILFSNRMKERRKAAGYRSIKALASVYNVRFRNGHASLEDDSGILGTLKNYENPNYLGVPRLDIVENICELIDCDVDYLLGKIENPKHMYEAMYEEYGISKKSSEQLKYWYEHGYTDIVNFILSSANFDNALREANAFAEIVPTAKALQEILEKKKVEIYSQPKPDGGYPSLNSMRENVKFYTTQRDIARLNLTDNLTFLVQELEKEALK